MVDIQVPLQKVLKCYESKFGDPCEIGRGICGYLLKSLAADQSWLRDGQWTFHFAPSLEACCFA